MLDVLGIADIDEVTGVYLDPNQKKLRDEIQFEVQTQPRNQSLPTLLQQVASSVSGPAATEIRDLLDRLAQPGATFDAGNLAYQALVKWVRGWPKLHRHAHIGESVHLAFMCNEAKRQNKPNAPDAWWHDLDVATRKQLYGKYGNASSYKGCAKSTTPDHFARLVLHVALQHFLDGVVELWLLVSPFRKFADKDGISHFIEAVLRAFDDAARITPSIPRECTQSNFKLRLVLSFARHQKQCDPGNVNQILRDAWSFLQTKNATDALAGIDLSGAEAVIDHTKNTFYRKTSDFKAAIAFAKEKGICTMAHLGDYGNTKRAVEAGPHPSFPSPAGGGPKLELADISSFDERMKYHLAFVKDGLDAGIQIINHGTLLAPAGSLVTKDPTGNAETFAGRQHTDPNLNTVDGLLDHVRRTSMPIYTCPTANVNSMLVELYRGHPFHQWLESKTRASLHVDDFYWGNVPSTLSEDIVKMMLAAENDWSSANAQVMYDLACRSASQSW